MAFQQQGPSVADMVERPGGAVTWAEIADGFADRHDVILPDLLGFGESDRPTAVTLGAHTPRGEPCVVARAVFGGSIANEAAEPGPG